MTDSHPSWERKSRRILLDTPHMRVYEDSVLLPGGVIIDDYTIVNMPSGVVVVATDCDDNLIMQYEYKYAIDKTILNLPSGSVGADEPVLAAAKRELLEETGYTSEDFSFVGELYEYPSKADHLIYVVRAKSVKKVAIPVFEATESISPVILMSPEEKKYKGMLNTTYNVSAIALTMPNLLKNLL